ncbi:MAG: ATP-binding protein [Acidobacteriota bacterium]
MPTLEIQLLADFRLILDGTPLTGVSSLRLQSLLAYLVLRRDAPQSRQRLAFMFWPDSLESQARNNFRQLLFELRHTLPDAGKYLDSEGSTLQWRASAPFTLDVDNLEAAYAESERAARKQDRTRQRAALEQIVALYRGDLLPGCYDDWIAPERERLREKFIAALECLVELLYGERDYAAAIKVAQDLLRYDPVHEATYRRLMHLYALKGDRPGALRTFHTCATVLQHELAVAPSRETRQLYEDVLKFEPSEEPHSATSAQAPLVGRLAEWKRLQALWLAAASGQAQLLAIEGEAGIGKTRIAEELLAWVRGSGHSTAAARCYAAEGALAFAPVTAWLRARPLPALEDVHLAEVARLVPEILTKRPDLHPAPLTAEWQRQHLFESLAHALIRGPQPLLLFLDDLQWCDSESLAFLRFLLRFDPQARLLVATTWRPEETMHQPGLEPFILALRQHGQCTPVELGPLTEPETISLANAVLGRPMDVTLAQRVFQETEGNPLFIVETTRALASGQGALSPKVQAAIGARLAQLSPDARRLADVAATIGREFTVDVLAKARDAGEDALVRGLDELWRCRIVRERDSHYDFTHGKLRDIIESRVSGVRSRWLHQRVAEALESVHAGDLDVVSAQIAAHYDKARKGDLAIRYYERAADVALRLYANAGAVAHYRRALALCDATISQDHTARLWEELGEALLEVGEYDECREACRRALTLVTHPITCARLHKRIGFAWREQNHYPQAVDNFTEAERILSQALGQPTSEWWQEWIDIKSAVGSVYYWMGSIEQDDRLRQALEPAVRKYGTPNQRAAYYNHVSNTEFRRNRSVSTPETTALTKAALSAYQEAGNPALIAIAHFMVGFRVLWGRDPEGALQWLEPALKMIVQTGHTQMQARCLTYLTVAYRQCGRIKAAREYAERSLQIATLAHMPEYIGTAKANQAWIAYRAEDSARAKELGSGALETWHQLPPTHASLPFQWLALMPLIAVAMDEQQLGVAVDYTRVLLDPKLQRLPDDLAASLEQAVHDWDTSAQKSAHQHLQQSLTLARQLRYL